MPVFFDDKQNKRIKESVEAYERSRTELPPTVIEPRFSSRPAPPGLVRFQLEEDLTTAVGLHAKAKLLKLASPSSTTWIIDEDKDPIEVYDWFRRNSDYPEVDSPGMWFGKAGYRGWAQKRTGATAWEDEGEEVGSHDDETREKYDIVWMERISERVMFYVPEGNFLDSSSGTTVLSVQVIRDDGQGIHPTATFESSGEELILNVPFFFSDICQYAYGFAEYDYTEGKYYIVECTRVAQFATATLNQDMTGNEYTDIAIDGFQIIQHGDFQLHPEVAPTTAKNPYQHAAPENYQVLLMRTGLAAVATGEPQPWTWTIIDVPKRETNLIIDLMFGVNESVETAIQYKERTVRMEFVDPETEPEWQTLVVARNCQGDEE